MIIPFNTLSEQIRTDSKSSSGWFENYSEVKHESISVLMLCILYHNQKISRESFTARMTMHIKDKSHLSRRIGTYHSTVNGKWYQDIIFTNVLVEEVNDTCSDRNLNIKDYLKLLNIGFSRNTNYCVDFLAFEIFKPIMGHYNRDWVYRFFSDCQEPQLNLTYLSFEEADRKYDLGSGYCCEDHDGDFEAYKQSRYNWLYKNDDEKELSKSIQSVMLNYKRHLKNPEDKLLYHW